MIWFDEQVILRIDPSHTVSVKMLLALSLNLNEIVKYNIIVKLQTNLNYLNRLD